MRRLVLLVIALFWASLISWIVVPWGRFVDHPHWGNVITIPFVSPPYRPRDIILNVLLYVPLGAALAGAIRRRRLLWVCGLALGLSLATEYTQLYSHRRYPSMTDVVTNTLGGMLGAGVVMVAGRTRTAAVGRVSAPASLEDPR